LRRSNAKKPASAKTRVFLRYDEMMDYQACLKAPFAVLGVRCTEDALVGIDFLPLGMRTQQPSNALAEHVCAVLMQYLRNRRCQFDLPLLPSGTPFQRHVWTAMQNIPPGQVVTYAELARWVDSGARAVANACGANPIPIIIPCHRVVAAHGLGGFMQGYKSSSLAIKQWLIEHEREPSRAA
jgi:methylated-DNA-[protein]-cysteine S-methyltransferase